MKKIILLFFVCFVFTASCFAEDKITILISGQSHSSLYPCSCPVSPIGGVSRRATLIKKIKAENKNVLVLESGGSFAGGNFDTTSQTTDIDRQRTEYYMQSLAKMGYDAFLVSSIEFNFGEEFLKKSESEYKLNYLSANLEGELSYIIKEINGAKIAVIGITDEDVKTKTQIPCNNPEASLAKIIKEVRQDKKVGLVIVLSYLEQNESKEILNKIKGVDIWVSSNNPFMQAGSQDVNGTLLVVPAWQTRQLTKLSLDSKTFKVSEVEHIDLSDAFTDDSEIVSIVPKCFTDKDCHKKGHVAKCQNAGTQQSACEYSQFKPAKLSVVKPKSCKTCNVSEVVEKIMNTLPNLNVVYFDEDSKQGQDLIKKLGIKMLPAYLIELTKDNEEVISNLGQVGKKKNGYYVFEPGFTGVSFIAGRKKIPNRLDLFFDIDTKDMVKILEVLRLLKEKRSDIDIRLNFLAVEDPELGLIAKGDKYEIEEFLRCACVNKYYPDKMQDYLSCRLSDIASSWWDNCAVKFSIDPAKIKTCAQADEGLALLKDFIKLTQELEVVFGPTFLVNNQEIFSSEGIPNIEELEDLFE
jgi:hypothetical protein